MEKIYKILQEAVSEIYKTELIIEGCYDSINKNIENSLMQKYKGNKIKRDGLEFELYGIKSSVFLQAENNSIKSSITLFFFIINYLKIKKNGLLMPKRGLTVGMYILDGIVLKYQFITF